VNHGLALVKLFIFISPVISDGVVITFSLPIIQHCEKSTLFIDSHQKLEPQTAKLSSFAKKTSEFI